MTHSAARAALVTGATSGIGRALALGLAEDGYAVTAAGRDVTRAQAVETEARSHGWELTATIADLAHEAGIVAMLQDHHRRYGRLDILVNNAGIGMGGIPVESMPSAVIEEQIAVNLRAPFLVSREGIPALRRAGAEHGEALLLNIASIAAREPGAGQAIYAAVKAGVGALGEAVRKELAGSGVQVTTFFPAFTASAMVEPVRRMGISDEDMIEPDDLLKALRFVLATSRHCVIPEIQFDSPRATAAIQALQNGATRAPMPAWTDAAPANDGAANDGAAQEENV